KALHAWMLRIHRPGEQVPVHLHDGKLRQHKIAEATAPALAVIDVCGRAEVRMVSKPVAKQRLDLVLASPAGKSRKIDRHLLQADDVEIPERPGSAGNATGID